MDFNKSIIFAAIAGDIAGSTYETTFPYNYKNRLDDLLDQGHFTDDTVLTIAVLDALKRGRPMADSFKEWACKYPNCGFSRKFKENFVDNNSWIVPPASPSSSNGAIMMLSPFIALKESHGKFDFLKEGNPMQRLYEAVNVSHNCDMARRIANMYVFESEDISPFVPTYTEIENEHMFDMSALGTLVKAAACYGASESLEDTICHAIRLGGDTDTTASIAAVLWMRHNDDFSEETLHMVGKVQEKLTGEMLKVIERD